ncbi:hypothetical protein J6590_076937 [Homalodisca vitripennis]|nr:hypothetical protein J6590_076937 [Homalodisca vitripennis]
MSKRCGEGGSFQAFSFIIANYFWILFWSLQEHQIAQAALLQRKRSVREQSATGHVGCVCTYGVTRVLELLGVDCVYMTEDGTPLRSLKSQRSYSSPNTIDESVTGLTGMEGHIGKVGDMTKGQLVMELMTGLSDLLDNKF